MTRIGAIGVGAIGGTLAGFMAKSGEDVTLIDPWREHVDSMRESGLLLDGSTGGHRVKVNAIHTDELDRLEGAFDILLIAVKSYDTEWATKLMLPFMHDETMVVSPQNGINELRIAPIIGHDRMVGCVTTISAGMMEPAHITRTDSMSQSMQTKPVCFSVGELDGTTTARIERLAELFEPAGHTVVTNDLWGERWSKMATNCMANPISAMTGLPTYDMRADERIRRLMLRLCVEAIQVGRALGYHVKTPVGEFSLDDLIQASLTGHEELEKKFVGQPQKLPGWPSMAQDVIKGRRTEIEHLNGFVSEHGRRIGMPTPYSDAAVSVIRGIESGEFEQGMKNVDRMEAMVRAG